MSGDAIVEARPLVSIVIPCYRQAHYLNEAIESSLGQSYSPIEIIVVDDESPDEPARVTARFPGITIIRQRNSGVAAARNFGAARASGSLLVFLDADDRLRPGAVDSGMRALRTDPDAALAFGGAVSFDSAGNPVDVAPPHVIGSDPYAEMLERNYIWSTSQSIYRREAFEKVGGYDSGVDPAADYALTLKIARSFRIVGHQAVVTEYRLHPASMSSDPGLMLAAIMSVLQREQKHVRGPTQLAAYRGGLKWWRAHYCHPSQAASFIPRM